MARTGFQAVENFETGCKVGAGLMAANAATAWRREGAYQEALAGGRIQCAQAATAAVARVERDTVSGLVYELRGVRADVDAAHHRVNALEAAISGTAVTFRDATPTTERDEAALRLALVWSRAERSALHEEIEDLEDELAA